MHALAVNRKSTECAPTLRASASGCRVNPRQRLRLNASTAWESPAAAIGAQPSKLFQAPAAAIGELQRHSLLSSSSPHYTQAAQATHAGGRPARHEPSSGKSALASRVRRYVWTSCPANRPCRWGSPAAIIKTVPSASGCFDSRQRLLYSLSSSSLPPSSLAPSSSGVSAIK